MARSLPRHHRILVDLLSLPTAPFAEQHVLHFVEAFCRQRGVRRMRRDAVGNLLVNVRIGSGRVPSPVCITSHMDHPGFVAEKMMSPHKLRAQWNGGVAAEYFNGSAARFYHEGRWIKGRVESHTQRSRAGRKRVDKVIITLKKSVPKGAIGMWDFPDPRIRGSQIHARACDDLIGVGAMLGCIDNLTRSKKPCEAYFLFTRAEEVGFAGAILAAKLGTIPKKCVIVAMEASPERSFAKIGDGPILRVGDRSTTFTHAATAYCQRVAQQLEKRDKKFKYQRKLMDGGTCESSAYATLGYDATGLCVALGNYHNVDARRKKLAPEYVDLNDFANVVKWFVALATSRETYTGRDERMLRQLVELEKTYKSKLLATVPQ